MTGIGYDVHRFAAGRPLVARHALAYAPSAAVLASLRALPGRQAIATG